MLNLLRRGGLFVFDQCLRSDTIHRPLFLSAISCQSEHLNPSKNSILEELKASRKQQARHPRPLSTLKPAVPTAAPISLLPKDEIREFMAVFPDIVRDLTATGKHADIPYANKWFAKVLQYNVPSGKKNRGLTVAFAYKQLAPPKMLTPENMRLAYIMGWCVEMLQACFILEDDIMDGALTRRGKPCWYKNDDIGLSAINDGFLLEAGIFHLCKMHFRNQPYYLEVVELFLEVLQKTHLGQMLDLHASLPGKRPKFDIFTMDTLSSIAKYKTAYYTFYLPIALGMHMAGFKDEEVIRQSKTILLEMGQFFQMQDDYLDCFGDPELTGKIGTDIEDGKCTWLAVVALQRVTPKQRKLFEECYGYKDEAKVAAVKELYELLGIPTTYSIYEEDSYNLINTHIQQISRGLPHSMFFKIMDKLYKRER